MQAKPATADLSPGFDVISWNASVQNLCLKCLFFKKKGRGVCFRIRLPVGATLSRLSAMTMLLIAIHADAQDRRLGSNSRLVIGTESRLSASVRAADIDANGHLDIVVANGRHWPQQNMLFLNHGRAHFSVARPLGIDLCTSYACEFADLDGDQDLDIAVGNDNAPCLIFTNDGTGHFQRHGEFGSPSSVRSLTAADIDGDGDIDLLTTCRGRPNRIDFNDGNAQFSNSTTFGTSDDSTIDVAVADLNEDGLNDLILANRDAQPNSILLNIGKGQFAAPIGFGAAKFSSRAIATADFDSDGHIDWIVGNIGAANTVCFGDGRGGVDREIQVGQTKGQTYCLAVADVNRDGLPDFVVGNMQQPNAVFYNVNMGQRFIEQPFGEVDSATYGLCVGDFTGDGFADVAVANSNQQNRIYVNQPARKSSP